MSLSHLPFVYCMWLHEAATTFSSHTLEFQGVAVTGTKQRNRIALADTFAAPCDWAHYAVQGHCTVITLVFGAQGRLHGALGVS